MSDYGIFESIEGSDSERKIASRDTQRKLDAAIDDVKRQYGSFLYASRDAEEWNDRVALCKNDMIKTVNNHLYPVTGVMRRIVKACKDDWKRQADKTGPAMDNDVTFAPKKDKDLKPKGDFESYKNKVDQNSDAVEDNCFKEAKGKRHGDDDAYFLNDDDAYARVPDEGWIDDDDNPYIREGYRYAENDTMGGGGYSAGTPNMSNSSGMGDPVADPSAQAPNVAVGVPGVQQGIQASRNFYADATSYGEIDDEIRRQTGKELPSFTSVPGLFRTEDSENPTLGSRRDSEGNVIPDSAPASSGGSDPDAFKDLSGVGPKSPTPVKNVNNLGANTPSEPASAPTSATPTAPAAAGPAAAPVSDAAGSAGANDNGGGAGGAAPRPMTTGDVADGGRAGAENGNNAAITGKDYVVQQGDTLTDIAQRGYGDMNKYDDLAKANGISNPDDISVGTTIKALDGSDFSGNNNIPGNLTNPAGGGSDNLISTPDAGPAAKAPAPAPTPAAGQPIVSSLALSQYIDWCDSFGARRASVKNLDIYARNLNDRAYFEIASALTDPDSPIYRTAAPGVAGGNGAPAPQTVTDENGLIVNNPVNIAPQAVNPVDLGAGAGQGFGGGGPGAFDLPGFGREGKKYVDWCRQANVRPTQQGFRSFLAGGQKRTAAPDYLQKADEALTNLLNQKAEEFQETIAPLQQALQTVQQAEALQQAQNPLGVQPPAGTVNVLPQQPGGDPSGAAGGGDPSGGGMDPAQALAGMGGGGMPPGGGDPSMGGGVPPMDPSQMQMQARRRQARPEEPAYGSFGPDWGAEEDNWDDEHVLPDSLYHPKNFIGGDPYDEKNYRRKDAKRGGQGGGVPPMDPSQMQMQARRRQAVDSVKMHKIPECDVCKYDHGKSDVPASYDGKTKRGPWAYMCEDCFKENGVGLGTGRGQRFESQRKQRDRQYPMPVFAAGLKTASPLDQSAGYEELKRLNALAEDLRNQYHSKWDEIGDDMHPEVVDAARRHAEAESAARELAHQLIQEKAQDPNRPIGMSDRFGALRTADNLKAVGKTKWINPDAPKKGRGAKAPHHAGIVNDVDQWGKQRGVTTGNPEVDMAQFESETGKTIGPKQRNKLTKPTSTANPMPKSKQPISTGMPKRASFFTRKVAGWEWDDHLNGYLANKPNDFTCKCGSKHPVPSYSTCKCGKIWNSYVIGTGGDHHQASVEKFICREIPVREGVIVAKKRQSEMIKYTEDEEEDGLPAKSASCKCWKGYERVPGTRPCAEGSCRKCDSHRKKESGKVKRHKLSDPGPLGDGKDDKMPDISEDLGNDWYKRGPGGKYARRNRRGR